MIFFTLYGKPINRSINRYRINWDEKSKSRLQFRAKQLLRRVWYNDIVCEEFPCMSMRLRVDFVNLTKKIAVEVNGPQHDTFNSFFHNNSRFNFLSGIKRDIKKAEWLQKNNIRLIEIIESDFNNIQEFYNKIK